MNHPIVVSNEDTAGDFIIPNSLSMNIDALNTKVMETVPFSADNIRRSKRPRDLHKHLRSTGDTPAVIEKRKRKRV